MCNYMMMEQFLIDIFFINMIISRVVKSKLFSNIFNQFLLYGFSQILPFLLMPYLLATIGVAKYGLVNFALAFSFYFQVVNEWGFDLSNVRHVVKNRDDSKELSKIFWSIIGCKGLLFIVSSLIYTLIVLLIPKFHGNEWLYFWSFIRLFGIIITPFWLFRSMEDMKYVTRISLMVKCFCILPIFFIVKFPGDYNWVMFFFSLEAIFSGIVSLLIAIKRYRLLFYRVRLLDIRFYFKDSLPFFTSVFLTRIYQTSNTFVLGLVCGDSVTGIYSASEKLYNAYASLVAPLINHIFYPYFSRIKNLVRINKMVLTIILSNLIILIMVYIVSPYLIPIFIKVEVNNIVNYFNIFLLVLVFSISNEILGFPYLGILGQIKEVKDSTWYASLFYLSLLLLFLFFGMVNVLNLILLLLGTNIVCLLFRLWFIKKTLSQA